MKRDGDSARGAHGEANGNQFLERVDVRQAWLRLGQGWGREEGEAHVPVVRDAPHPRHVDAEQRAVAAEGALKALPLRAMGRTLWA